MRQKIDITGIDTLNKWSNLGLWLAIGGAILQWVILGLYWRRLPPEVPLYYSLPYGAGQLADKIMVLLLPGLSSLFVMINVVMLKIAGKINTVITDITVWANNLSVGLLLLAQIYMLMLVF